MVLGPLRCLPRRELLNTAGLGTLDIPYILRLLLQEWAFAIHTNGRWRALHQYCSAKENPALCLYAGGDCV